MDDTNRPTSKKRTRNVSGLSEEQVQQKRNIDRKAQRAFRQRTRDRIAQLEHDLAELEDSSGQREAQYQTQIDDLRADNQQLLRRLESIASLATSSTVPGEIAFAGLHESPTVWRGVTQPSQPAGVAGVAEGHPDDRDDTGMSAASVQRSQLGPAGAGSQQSAPPFQVPRPDIDCDGPDAHSMNRNNSADLSSDPTIIVRHASIPSVDAFRLPETYRNHRPPPSPPALAEISNDTNSTSIHSPAEAVSVAQETPRGDESHLVGMRPVFAVLPVHISPTCPLDQILLGFFNSQRELLGSGASPETVIGPPRPSAKVLIRPGSSSSIDPISKVMSEVMMTFLYVGKAEQLALFYLMHQTMRVRFSVPLYLFEFRLITKHSGEYLPRERTIN